MERRAPGVLIGGAALVWAAPLAGLALAGRPLAPYLSFPPRTLAAAHAAFSWPVFVLFLLPCVAALALYAAAFPPGNPRAEEVRTRPFPSWGWAGLALCAAGWALAWSDVVPPQWRRHTFTPLWLGYALVMNALAFRAGGEAPLVHRTKWFLWLFLLSAGFWWLFEHLNQFVRNWHYTGVERLGDRAYFAQATLPFSTVLPAVASTWAWLRTFPRFDALLLFPVRFSRGAAWLCLGAGLAVLSMIGILPEALFPALWVAPPLVLLGLQQLVLGETILAPLAHGDWRPLLQPAAAALVCGVFWELWNWGSLSRWEYSIPYVERFRLFEMPALGYAGYLPFGITCALVLDLAARAVEGGRSLTAP